MPNTLKIKAPGVKIIAHRGLSGLETENTASAFVAAGNRSYFGIETDVHRTLDGRFIIIHDDQTGRVAADALPVEGSRFELLRSIRLNDIHGGRSRADLMLPSLREYAAICRHYEKVSVLELKNHFAPDDIAQIVEIVREENQLVDTIFISFDLPNMIALRNLLPDQPLQFLTGWYDSFLISTLTRHRLDLDIRHTALTADIVRELHDSGIKVNCWTVNTVEDGERLAGYGVDYITTNILEQA